MNTNSYNIEGKEKMKIVIFGLGKIYKDNFHNISRSDEIVAFSDNDKNLQGKVLEGKKIVSPIEICELSYDKIVIMASHFYACQIKNQLIEFGISSEQILYWEQYIYIQNKFDFSEKIHNKNLKNILIVTSDLGYHGGAMVCIFLAEILMGEGYDVTLLAPSGSVEFINEYRKKGFFLKTMRGVQYAKFPNICGITNFDFVIVNTYPMILFALEISKKVRTVLWLHESENIYASMEFWHDYIIQKMKTEKLDIYAVSEMARRNFCKNFEDSRVSILEYGMPDILNKSIHNGTDLTFAMIGTVLPFKQQHMFIDAIELLQTEQKYNNQFWIVGKISDTQYGKNIVEKIRNKEYIQYLGEKSQNELIELYDDIDVIVVCSEQESLPIVVIEGFMRSKPCIVCDNTGLSYYIHNNIQGIIYKTGNVQELMNAMKFFIDNRACVETMGQRARKLFEDKFSLQKFKERLQMEWKI